MTTTVNSILTNNITPIEDIGVITNFTSIVQPQNCVIKKHIGNTHNIYLNYPSSSYNINLYDSDFLDDNNQFVDVKNNYKFRNIFRGQYNSSNSISTYDYDRYVLNNFDTLSFQSKMRFVNRSADVITVRIDTRSITNEFGSNNWSMTTVSNINPEQIFSLNPGCYLLLDLYFDLKTIFVEYYKIVETDIHEQEITWAYQYRLPT